MDGARAPLETLQRGSAHRRSAADHVVDDDDGRVADIAREQLARDLPLAAMLLHKGEVDGTGRRLGEQAREVTRALYAAGVRRDDGHARGRRGERPEVRVEGGARLARVLPGSGKEPVELENIAVRARVTPEAAVALYEECLRLAPRNHRCLFNLGRLAGALGDRGRQRELWEAAIEVNPDFARGYFLLAKLLMDGGAELRRAEELTREGIERDPERRNGPLGHYLLADILNRRGRLQEAGVALAEARRIEAAAKN